jgi:N-formylglutamate deformylase
VAELAVVVQAGTAALLLDSPHSGVHYPQDFDHALPVAQLRDAEDTHVEKLFAPWTALGATLVAAQFPRSYIDPNRAADDIDYALLEETWPHAANPTRKALLGKGLVWRCLDDGTPIYSRRLPVAEVKQRITRYWQPYWDALEQQALRIRAAKGHLYHINCHSMPSMAAVFATDQSTAGTQHADFVVGDRDGTTAAAEYVHFVIEFLRARGYRAAYNDPYKGVEIVRRLGDPVRNNHSLQLEVNRKLYMDEASRALNAGFAHTQAELAALGKALVDRFSLR